jgi:hypothetical protein
MLRRVLIGFACAIPGYLMGAFGGGWLIDVLSSNRHDRGMEAAMTGAFVLGPAVAVIAFVIGLVMAKPRGRA